MVILQLATFIMLQVPVKLTYALAIFSQLSKVYFTMGKSISTAKQLFSSYVTVIVLL